MPATHPTPALTGNWQSGCNLAGDAKPMSKSVQCGEITITFTGGAPIISTTNPLLHRALATAAESVGDRTTRINQSQ